MRDAAPPAHRRAARCRRPSARPPRLSVARCGCGVSGTQPLRRLPAWQPVQHGKDAHVHEVGGEQARGDIRADARQWQDAAGQCAAVCLHTSRPGRILQRGCCGTAAAALRAAIRTPAGAFDQAELRKRAETICRAAEEVLTRERVTRARGRARTQRGRQHTRNCRSVTFVRVAPPCGVVAPAAHDALALCAPQRLPALHLPRLWPPPTHTSPGHTATRVRSDAVPTATTPPSSTTGASACLLMCCYPPWCATGPFPRSCVRPGRAARAAPVAGAPNALIPR